MQDHEKFIAELRAENEVLRKRIAELERGRRDKRGRFTAQPGVKFGLEFHSDGSNRSMRIVQIKAAEPDPNPNTHEKIFKRMDALAAQVPEPDDLVEPVEPDLFQTRNHKT